MSKCKSKKRFSDEQIRSLESMFYSETRPESQTKQQIADQLGLMPRQVAIWFQNRRARCKSKQIEHDYRVLKASYDNLAGRFESLKREHCHLTSEVQRLRGLQSKSQETMDCIKEESNIHEADRDGCIRGLDKDYKEDNKNPSTGCFEEEAKVVTPIEPSCGSPLSSANCYSLESILEPDCFLGDNCVSEWWGSY